MAAANGHVDIIREILSVKKDDKLVANLDSRNSEGCTPLRKKSLFLSLKTKTGLLSIVKRLL